jgi:hypothetical protein
MTDEAMKMEKERTDRVFYNLEQLAFMGMWSRIEHEYVWCTLGIRKQLEKSHTSPEHDRFQHLCAVYATVCDIMDSGIDGCGQEIIDSYITTYRIPETNIPSRLRIGKKAVCSGGKESASASQYMRKDGDANP